MAAIKGKWKALLVLNYICSAIWLLLLFTFFWMYYRANQGSPEIKSDSPYIAVGVLMLLLINILFIYTLQTHLPSRSLSKKVKVLYVGGLIFEGFVTFLLIFVFAFNVVIVLSNNTEASNDIFITVFLFVLLSIYVLLFIWQVQLMKLLERNAENELKSVLNSIGTDENNNVE